MLIGKDNTGKTETLNLVYNELLPSSVTIEYKKQLGKQENDFESIIEYQNKRIAFYTMGDRSRDVCSAMNKYHNKCDILILACNDKFKNPLKRMKETDKKVEKTPKDFNKQEKDANEEDKNKIINLIKN